MFKDVIIGQYVEGNSFIHRLDSKIKIILTMLFMVLLFVVDSVPAYLCITLYVATIVIMCDVPFKLIIKGLKPMLFILAFTAVMNLFMTSGEALVSVNVFSLFTISVSKQGVINAVFMVIRLLYLLISTSVLTLTTTPLMLTDGIERLLRPLKVIKVPSHEIAMMMTIALRFIPTLADETDKIMKAQAARGADFESGSLIRRAKAMIPILVPLFVSAFRRADELATAMESRCYTGGEGRTKMNESHVTSLDYLATGIFVMVALLALSFEYIIF